MRRASLLREKAPLAIDSDPATSLPVRRFPHDILKESSIEPLAVSGQRARQEAAEPLGWPDRFGPRPINRKSSEIRAIQHCVFTIRRRHV